LYRNVRNNGRDSVKEGLISTGEGEKEGHRRKKLYDWTEQSDETEC